MPDIKQVGWFFDVPNETEHTSRIANILDIKEYLLRKHKVLLRKDFNFKEETFKTAKIVINTLKSIVNFHVSYTIGSPLSLNGDSEIVTAFNKIIKKGSYNKTDYEIVTDLIKYGNAYEYIYLTKDNIIKSKIIAPEDSYPIYDENYEYMAFVEYWEDSTTNKKNYIVYYPEKVEVYQDNTLVNSYNNLSGLPIHYCGLDKSAYNHFGDSILNDMMPIMDNIESLLSKLDDAITTLSLNPIGISSGQRINESIPKDIVGSTLNLEDGGSFNYASATMDYSNIKLLLDSLVEQLYSTACVPSSLIGQSNISNISEVSLKLLYTMTENRAKQTLQVVREGIYKRLSHFNNLLKYIGYSEFSQEIFDTIDIVFQQNLPTDTTNLMNGLKTQFDMGAISKQTIIDVSPFTLNSVLEMERIDAENKTIQEVQMI